jgi:hypothetical protein
MPNIEILNSYNRSVVLKAIQKSNAMKIDRESRQKRAKGNRAAKYDGKNVAAVA